MTTETRVSRILLFTRTALHRSTVAALAAAAGAEPDWTRMVRRDGSEADLATVTLGGGLTVEIAEGEPAGPALLELTVSDLAAATARLEAAGFEVGGGMAGPRVRVGGLTVALQQG